MMGTVRKVSSFFNAHPKHQKALEKPICNTQPESNIKKVKDLCRTRWVERLHAFHSFMTLHPSIVACMAGITREGSQEWSREALADANSLLLAITTTDFISALILVLAI